VGLSRFSGLSGFSIAALANRINISVSNPIFFLKKQILLPYMTSISECIFRLGHHTPQLWPIVIVSEAPTSHHRRRHLTERVGARIQYVSAANPRSEGAPREREFGAANDPT